MAFDTFISPTGGKFSVGSSETRRPRILSAGFGDGYAQEAGDGLNSDLSEMRVSWDLLTPDEAQPIMEFFKAHKGYIPFKFTLPGEAIARKWKATEYTRTWTDQNAVSVSATWKEAVDPE